MRALPTDVEALLSALDAPPRLRAHLALVHDVAATLADAVRDRWPTLELDEALVRFGAATHDIGKAVHRRELVDRGALHEAEGERLLLARGVDARRARFARTHASWRDSDVDLEDLVVALADTCWKGKRDDALEQRVVAAIARTAGLDAWAVFATLDDIVAAVATEADVRLAWQSQFAP